MKITQITKLKKFGIFRTFCWDYNIPDFKKYNLIYGWNKSGKTILSRIFSAIERKSTEFSQYPVNGEFEIKSENKITTNNSNCQDCALQIKVFNKDFIDENVSFDPSNPSNPIVYVGEEDIKSSKRLKELREKVEPLFQKLKTAQGEREKNEKAEDSFRIAAARTIKDIVGNLKVNNKYRDYDKSTIKKAIEDFGIDKLPKLTDDNFEKYKKTIISEAMQKQSPYPKYTLRFTCNGKQISSFSEISGESKNLLNKKIFAETIKRLKDDPDLNAWVQHGFELHKRKKEKQKCLFCQNKINEDFLASLSKHFSDDYKNLQKNVTAFINGLADLKKEKATERNNNLYEDLQISYQEQIKDLNRVIEKLNAWIDEITKKLQEKFENPLILVNSIEKPEDFSSSYNKIVENIIKIISTHNKRVDNHDQEIKKAKEMLEKHLIATAIEEQDYKKIKQDLETSIRFENKAQKEYSDNNNKIKKLEKETSNIGKAVLKINNYLEEFFGRNEIQLELDDFKKGYLIKRDDEIARNLSESEKNAIAFSYFIVKSRERGFNLKDGIIFIDDPISSFDSNFIYHCFSLIKNKFNESAQLFITTHNFEFFSLLKDWFEQKNRGVEHDNKKISDESKKKPLPCAFFMIENVIEKEKRCAQVKQLDETLSRFKSEYHFLFSRLSQFLEKTSPEYADFYVIGNIARRFLEIFANFKIPKTGDLASKVGQLNIPNISDTKKDKVYNLIQEFSHGRDPSSIIEHKDKSEIREAVKVLLDIVKESDQKHFESLQSNL